MSEEAKTEAAKPAKKLPTPSGHCPECGGKLVEGHGEAPIQGTRRKYLSCDGCPYFWTE